MANRKPTCAIGLVLGAAEMRAVELSKGSLHPRVTAFGRTPLPPGLVADGMIADIPAAAALLGQLLREHHFSKAPLMVGIKNQNVLLRMATFPKVPEDKMKNAILFQAQPFIPVPIGELVLDYVPCGDASDTEIPSVNVLLVGAKKALLEQVVDLAKAAGRALLDVDSSVLASLRAGLAYANPQEGEVLLLADVDRETISMAICRGKTIVLVRTIPLSAALLSAAAAGGEPPELEPIPAAQLAAQLASDAGASMRYFATQSEDTIDRMLLTGAYRQMEQIAQRTESLLGLPVQVVAPYAALGGIDSMRYAACISLALRGLEG